MTKILEFYYKDKLYTIYETDRIDGKNSYVGETRYEEGIILIERGSFKEMLTTLKHELAHVWLYEHGHSIQDDGCFNYEDLCEYIALSNNFVYEITSKYINEKDW